MKKLGKTLSGILAGVILLSNMLTGCSGGKQETSGGVKKFGKITVGVSDSGKIPASEGTATENRWTKWINENGPVDVEYVGIPSAQLSQKLNVMFASDTAPDVIYVSDPYMRKPLYEQKQLQPLDDMINKYSVEYKKRLENQPALKKSAMEDDGNLYTFGRTASIAVTRAIVIRSDWLKKLNLQMPKTTEELYEVAKAFASKDPDGNGKDDTYGIAVGFPQLYGTLQQVFGDVRWQIKDEKIDNALQGRKDFVAFMRRLYEGGIIDKDFINDKNGAKSKQDFVTGKVGIYPNMINWYNFTINEYASLKKNVPEAQITVLPYPKSNVGEFNPSLSDPIQMQAVVKEGAKNLEGIMKFIDFMSREATGKTLQYGIEGVHYSIGDNGKPRIIDMDKYKKEVSWASSYNNLQQLESKFDDREDLYNQSNPIEKDGLELYKLAKKVYLDPNRLYPGMTVYAHMPIFPKEMNVNFTNSSQSVEDITYKAILSGNNYTLDKANKDLEQIYSSKDYIALQKWLQDWYDTHKDKAILMPQINEMLKKQQMK